MAKRTIKKISMSISSGTFSGIFSKFRRAGREKSRQDSQELALLRQVLSNERIRILRVIRERNPSSLYQLSRFLERDFKSVREDVKLLEKLGFLELDASTKGKRELIKPILAADRIIITIDV